MNGAKQLYYTSEVFEKGAIFNSSEEGKKQRKKTRGCIFHIQRLGKIPQ